MLNEQPPNAASGTSAEPGHRFGIPFCILLTLCVISLGSPAIHRHFDVEPYFTIGLVAAAVMIGVTGFVRWVRSGGHFSDVERDSCKQTETNVSGSPGQPREEHETKRIPLTGWQVILVVATFAAYYAVKLLLLAGR